MPSLEDGSTDINVVPLSTLPAPPPPPCVPRLTAADAAKVRMYWARIRANRESLGALAHNMWIAQGSIDTVHVQIDDDLKAIELLAQTGCTTHNLDPKQVVLNSDTGEFVPKDSIAVPLTRPGSHPR